MPDDTGYLRQIKARRISREFLSHKVSRLLSIHVIEHAELNGTLDELNAHLGRHLDHDLFVPTLEELASRKLTTTIDITDLEEERIMDAIFQGLSDLTHRVSEQHSGDILTFIYASGRADSKVRGSRYVFSCGAYDRVTQKLGGVYYDSWGKIPNYNIILGAVPVSIINSEKYVPHFIQEILNHQ